jgi:hypothetical protein
MTNLMDDCQPSSVLFIYHSAVFQGTHFFVRGWTRVLLLEIDSTQETVSCGVGPQTYASRQITDSGHY